MAKWGEGDPRWIVEERSDGRNVNNWHWTEKNASSWSKDKLRSLLEKLKVENDLCSCEIKEVTKLDGEASASNRKAKLIFFYEWEIAATWKGAMAGSDNTIKGKLEIPNLSEENEPWDIDVSVTTDDKTEEGYMVKEMMRKLGGDKVRDQLAIYVTQLKEEYSQGMILPTDGIKAKPTVKPAPETKNTVKAAMNKYQTSPSQTAGVKIHCSRITEKEEFKCRAGDIYRALTEKDMVRAFTRSDARIEAEKGGIFELFNGNVSGEFTQLELNKKLVMRWRYKTWPAAHYSLVTISLQEKEDCTELALTQTGVPDSDLDRTKEGWQRHYWQSIKQTFGFGAQLL